MGVPSGTLGGVTPTLAWVHNLDPFLVRITPEFGVRWYGLAYIAGFACAWLLLQWLARRRLILLTPTQATDAMFALILGVLLGGRLGYVLVYDRSLITTMLPGPPWWGVLAINKGGMASHGGMVGAILACCWVARRTRVPTLHLMDMFALATPPGLFFGRLANFVNGELLGRVAAAPGEPAPWWAVKFPTELIDGHAPRLTTEQATRLDALLRSVAPGEERDIAARRLIAGIQRGAERYTRELEPLLSARHPSQLYQAFAEGVVLWAALWVVWRRPRKPGVISACFLIVYGVGRICTEFWRLPDAHLHVQRPGGLSYGQWLSVGIIAGGIGILVLAARRGAVPIGGWARPRAGEAASAREG